MLEPEPAAAPAPVVLRKPSATMFFMTPFTGLVKPFRLRSLS